MMPFRDRPQCASPPLVISAGLPDEDDEVPSAQLLAIEEAVLSLSRAALSLGRRLVLPADPVVAPLVAEIAAEYAEGPRTEAGETPPPRVYVLFTEDRDEELAEILSGLHDVQIASFDDAREPRRGRHRLTLGAVERFGPGAAVVFGAAQESLDDFETLRRLEIPLYVIGSAMAGPLDERRDLLEYDVVGGVLAEIGWGGETDMLPDAERAVPYPYVMQWLIAQLGPTGLAE